ncbi:hypothetical protein Dsin_021487 [Dipteronia sinensis]|uniref:PGG domain-containing protein n=1 Tax=Dipteronia sinensis TaxID=43782 RepID=A0AAE0E095_9ROSI|nr:hypothetical protein Dsin_021487 [Dipteronia sinensis]
MVVAALIAIVVFSTTFTIHVGNYEKTRIPLSLIETAYRVFAALDTTVLSFYSISIIMFLSIPKSGDTNGFSEIFATQIDGWSLGSLYIGNSYDDTNPLGRTHSQKLACKERIPNGLYTLTNLILSQCRILTFHQTFAAVVHSDPSFPVG